MSPLARAADALLEASVVGSFSRIGISVRSRLLPEFSNGSGQPSTGRVAVITGATSGLGLAASTELSQRGWTVYFLARSRDRAEQARRTIAAAAPAGGSGTVGYGIADMEDQDSVRAFAREFRQAHDRLDVLVHAAGAIHQRFAVNHAGIELTVAGQLVTPFLLTKLLLPVLRAAAPSRVITVSSGGMYAQRLDPATLEMSPSGYRGAVAYARVKRAQVALSREWARRIDPAQVAFHAMHPGWADTPGIAVALPRFHRLALPILRTPEQGADTIVWLATAAPESLGSGCFWHDRRPRSEYLLPWTQERDPAVARHLWDSIDRAAGSLSGSWPGVRPAGT
jgi:dehydrogenase/reductase SDR family member 12